jgi:hypothetical protein
MMFEKEIKFIGDFCLNQVKFLGAHFTFQKIAATELHPAILRYISAELEYMIYSDRKKLLQHSYFDYSGKEISEHFKKIGEEIKNTKRIAFDDAKKLIVQAVSFNANYVMRPNWSLTQLIYNDQDTVSIDELEMMLNYIYYYEHLKKVLLAYLNKRNIVQISKTEFDLILKKIDQELVKSNAEQLIHNALASVGDFFNIGGMERNIVSPVAVEIFLKEKNMFNYLLKLRRGISDQSKKKYTIDAIKKALYADIVVEEKEEDEAALAENDEENLGELAEKHADNLDKAGVDELINLEEEAALLALYEEELKEDSSGEEIDFNDEEESEIIDADTELKDQEQHIEEPIGESTEKNIVNEMIKDYFDGEVPEDKDAEVDEKTIETAEGKTDEVVKEKKPVEIEDELLEVFEGLESDDSENQKLESPVSETTGSVEKEIIETEEKIEIEEESSLTEEDSIIKEIEAATSSEEETIPEEPVTAEEAETDETLEERAVRKKDLFSYLSRKETKKILSHIFLKDEEDFTNTVEKIMECHSYKEASDILRSVFNSYKVSPYAKDAVNFTNAVSNYFRQA